MYSYFPTKKKKEDKMNTTIEKKNTCRRGHPRTQENHFINRNGNGVCRVCRRERQVIVRQHEKIRDARIKSNLLAMKG